MDPNPAIGVPDAKSVLHRPLEIRRYRHQGPIFQRFQLGAAAELFMPAGRRAASRGESLAERFQLAKHRKFLG
jgi:hypothetical protein